MKLAAKELTAGENALLDALEYTPGDTTFLGKLYRDGVPTPVSYLAQPVRVLFVFREPSMGGVPHAHDMRDEVSDERFRPLRSGRRDDRSVRSWWNCKVGLFAHAVAAALAGEPERRSSDRFESAIDRGDWNHAIVNRFAYIQIKKIGGRGSSNVGEICEYAEKYAETLKAQIDLYRPHMIIGCGVGKASPSRLLRSHVLVGGREEATSKSGATRWRFSAASRPMAMLQLYQPSARDSRSNLYRDVWSSIDEVARTARIGRPG